MYKNEFAFPETGISIAEAPVVAITTCPELCA